MMVSWFLNDYGVINDVLLAFLFFSGCFVYFNMLILMIGVNDKYFSDGGKIARRFKIISKISMVIIGIGFFAICGYLYIQLLPGHLEVAKKYATPVQKAKLYDCLKKEYSPDAFKNQVYFMPNEFINDVVYKCKEESEKAKNYDENKKKAETMQESMSDLIEEGK